MKRHGLNRAGMAALLLFLMVGPAAAQKTEIEYYRESVDAYRSGDLRTFYRAAAKADSMRPRHPVLSYNLAAALSLNGEGTQALEILAERSDLYADTAFMHDPDFVMLRDEERYRELVDRVATLNRPLQSSRPFVEMELPGFHAEGLAYDSRTGTYLTGDVRSGRIVAFDERGEVVREIADLGAMGFWSVFGMEADPVSPGVLWVTTSAMPQFRHYSDSLDGRSAVLAIDLQNGELLHAYRLPGAHHFGDLEFGSDGTLYVSDGRQPTLYRIRPGGDSLETALTHPGWGNLQGLAADPETGTLYIADYQSGVYRYHKGDAGAKPLDPERNHLLKGTDGLAWHGGTLYAIQNGTIPMRVVAVEPEQGVEKIRHLDRALEVFDEPTTGMIQGNRFCYIANSPWTRYDENFDPLPGRWPPLRVYCYTLE